MPNMRINYNWDFAWLHSPEQEKLRLPLEAFLLRMRDVIECVHHDPVDNLGNARWFSWQGDLENNRIVIRSRRYCQNI